MDNQSYIAWEYLLTQKKMTHSVILHTQKLITLKQTDMMPHWRGYYRDLAQINVTVGTHVPPHYGFVKSLMDNFILDFMQNDSKFMHARFEDIHPFVDGNGRTGRMIMWWQQLKRGEELWLIKAKDRMEYYDWLNDMRKQWSRL
jgi:Fic family protein